MNIDTVRILYNNSVSGVSAEETLNLLQFLPDPFFIVDDNAR